MKRIKTSFIGKAFFSLIILYFVVFLFLFVFQGLVFRTYYTRRTIQNVKSEIAHFINKDTYNSIEIEELIFSRETQTISTLIPVQQGEIDVSKLDLSLITVDTGEESIILYAPRKEESSYDVGSPVSATAYKHDSDIYVPTYLSIDNSNIIRSNQSRNNDNESYLPEEFMNSQIQINGTIVNISRNTSSSINSLASNEILNIASKNYISIVDYSNGSYYFTNTSSSESSSLVFFSNVTVKGSNYLLVSVYPMDHVDDIVEAAGRANVYMFLVVLIILMIASFVYSREFSRPLLFINRKTKDLSLLDFSAPLIEIESSDEFSELAKNINILSVNLQTTLYQLSEQNKQLSDSLAKENENESSRREFVQGMSHELKTPLAVIQASAEALENDIYETDEEKEHALQLIQSEVLKTNKMIKSMMTVYKVDSTDYKTQWKEENLKDIILAIDESLSPLYLNSQLKVTMRLEDAVLKCDKDRIETVITNLYTNAIKYTPNNNEIILTLQNNLRSVSFSIQNFGTSISKEEQAKIFDAFYRVDKARSRSEGSTGLGLYIVNQTLEQYGSRCEISTDENSVTFSFTIKKSY